MRIERISYTEARLVSTAQFENARIEIGCTIALDPTDLHADALADAKEFVRNALIARMIEMESSAKREAYATEASRVSKKYRL